MGEYPRPFPQLTDNLKPVITISELAGGFINMYCTKLSSKMLLQTEFSLSNVDNGNYVVSATVGTYNINLGETFYTNYLLTPLRLGGKLIYRFHIKGGTYAGGITINSNTYTVSVGTDNLGELQSVDTNINTATDPWDIEVAADFDVDSVDIAAGDRIWFKFHQVTNVTNPAGTDRFYLSIGYSPDNTDYTFTPYAGVLTTISPARMDIYLPIGFIT